MNKDLKDQLDRVMEDYLNLVRMPLETREDLDRWKAEARRVADEIGDLSRK